MRNSNKTFDCFTHQYALSKTLRFELKPVGKTAEWIEKHDIIGVKEDKLIGKDAQKAEHYKYAKRLLDNLHRLFIEDALSKVDDKELKDKLSTKLLQIATVDDYELEKDKELQKQFQQLLDDTANSWIQQFDEEMPQFWRQDIEELKEKIANETNNQRKKGYKSAISAIDKKLKNPLKDFKQKGIKSLHSNTDALTLLEWKIRIEEVTATWKELGQNDESINVPVKILCDFLREFNKFSTYFSGFNENRQNVYDVSGLKSTSIINRTFKDNLSFHLANIQKWQTIKKSLENNKETFIEKSYDWQAELTKIESDLNCSFDEIMTVDSFLRFMNQTGIDEYIKCLGGQPALDGSTKIQGLNEFINLSRQQAGAKRSQFPPMQEFYKQILSKSDKTFIPEFSDDSDMFKAIREFNQDLFIHINDNDKTIFGKFFEVTNALALELADDYENLYLAKDKLTGLSNDLTGHWNNLSSELLEIMGEKPFNKRKQFSFVEIETALKAGCSTERFKLSELYQDNLITSLNNKLKKQFSVAQEAWVELVTNGILAEKKIDSNRINEGDTGFEQIAAIKKFLDASIAISGSVRDLQASKEILKIDSRNKGWYDHINDFVNQFKVIDIYNMVRNHVTKKPSATEKLKINFEKSTLLVGWDRNKESQNLGVIFEKDECFYLGIMTQESNNIFSYDLTPGLKGRKLEAIEELRKNILGNHALGCFRKINYKQIADVTTIIPKCSTQLKDVKAHFAKSHEIYQLSNPKNFLGNCDISEEIYRLNNYGYDAESKDFKLLQKGDKYPKKFQKAYVDLTGDIKGFRDALSKWMDFCRNFLSCYISTSIYEFEFKNNADYDSLDQFYQELNSKTYKLTFDNIKQEYINEKVDAGELYLFQIYNKDFSQNKKKKGTDNLHTIYWKGLFAPENLTNTVLKLNGQAEIFFRQASPNMKKAFQHNVGEILKSKSFSQTWKKELNSPVQKVITVDELKQMPQYKIGAIKLLADRDSQYTNVIYQNQCIGKICHHEIIKDKRFTQNKFFFHCPITLNFGAPGLPTRFNDKVRNFLKGNPDVNIIGIDRGEKHLLYYSVINQKGEILEQGSLNEIANGFIPAGATEERTINYHAKLDKIEQNRDKARKSWSTIENIKEMKAGYLSQVVHKLSDMIIKHNAIVVLEDLNVGFKRGRFGVEKQVYQKFEKALIDKLNYLVFKKEEPQNIGSYLNAYQLTNKFESFQKMGKQSGILFYTTASYTSTTDPITGFLKNVYPKYQSVEKSINFWKSFDSIIYNEAKDRFEFTYTLGNVTNKSMYKEATDNEKQLNKRTWTVCSSVTRSRYIKVQETQTEEQKQATTGEQIGNKGRHETFLATDKVKEILEAATIDYKANNDIKAQLLKQTEKSLHSGMIYAFNAIMTMRVTDDNAEKGTKENDFILSPVEPFFDSRKATAEQPENGDANGAYNIARKGICIINNINNSDDVSKANIAITKQQWQNFAQK